MTWAAGCAAPVWDVEVRELTAPTRASLRGVCAVSASIAWASGSDGTCLRTLDGGATWLACGPEQARGRDLRDVHAFDALDAVAMVVDSPALLLRTGDGGATWRIVWRDERPGAFLDGVAFSPAGAGFAFGDPVDGRFEALRSLDAGATWERLSGLPAPQPGEAAFAASGTSVAITDRGTLLAATGGGDVARVLLGEDFGTRWTSATTPVRSGTASRGIFSLAVWGERAVAVGGDHTLPEVAFANAALSSDAGRTWRAPVGTPPRGYRSAVAFVPGTGGTVLVAVGPTGSDLSRDGGDTFVPLGDVGYHALSFAPDGTGFAVGPQGQIARLARRELARPEP